MPKATPSWYSNLTVPRSSLVSDPRLRCRQLGVVMKLTDVSQQLSISDASIGALILQTGHELTEAFKAGDTDGSGSISKEELTKGLVTIGGKSEDDAKAEADKVHPLAACDKRIALRVQQKCTNFPREQKQHRNIEHLPTPASMNCRSLQPLPPTPLLRSPP